MLAVMQEPGEIGCADTELVHFEMAGSKEVVLARPVNANGLF